MTTAAPNHVVEIYAVHDADRRKVYVADDVGRDGDDGPYREVIGRFYTLDELAGYVLCAERLGEHFKWGASS